MVLKLRPKACVYETANDTHRSRQCLRTASIKTGPMDLFVILGCYPGRSLTFEVDISSLRWAWSSGRVPIRESGLATPSQSRVHYRT